MTYLQTTAFMGALVAAALLAAGPQPAAAQTPPYEIAGDGLRVLETPGGTTIRMLVEASNLGGDEVEIGEITFPPGTRTAGHSHGSTEVFYVISGELEHIVNGRRATIRPGMVGIVRPGDDVVHEVPGDEPVVALVVWAPGGEADRLGFESRPREENR